MHDHAYESCGTQAYMLNSLQEQNTGPAAEQKSTEDHQHYRCLLLGCKENHWTDCVEYDLKQPIT